MLSSKVLEICQLGQLFVLLAKLKFLFFSNLNLKPGSELFVACLGASADYGNLIVEIDAQERTTVAAHEHCGFIAEGLTVSAAINTLKCWLPLQRRTPGIQWKSQ